MRTIKALLSRLQSLNILIILTASLAFVSIADELLMTHNYGNDEIFQE